jgi:hypothetical protein
VHYPKLVKVALPMALDRFDAGCNHGKHYAAGSIWVVMASGSKRCLFRPVVRKLPEYATKVASWWCAEASNMGAITHGAELRRQQS